MALERFELIEGSTLTLALPDGCQLRADWQSGGATQSATVTASGGEAEFTPEATGNYYLAIRGSDTENWRRYGKLEVVPLVDLDYERMLTELASVNSRITEAQDSLIQYEFTDPSGTAAKRVTLGMLMRTRGMLEARIANYERALEGAPPVRWS